MRHLTPISSSPWPTLVDLLRTRALQHPDRTAYTFLVDGEAEEVTVTYGELDARARATAARLQAAGAAGTRALLLYPSGLDYLAAFFGCLYAGVVAVPAYPPRKNRSLDRIEGIVRNAEATFMLSTTPTLEAVERQFAAHPDLDAIPRLATDTLDLDDAGRWADPQVAPDTLAFLQYTSGSTGTPKGVMVSHGNLLHNQCLIQRAFQQEEHERVFGWLPLYHDMGLIGIVLQPLFVGAPCTLMAPVAFLQKPVRWLQGITRYGATTSGGPNFAYDLCVDKITPEQCDGLDLQTWTLAFNGSEPVRAETIDRFSRTFAPYGFQRRSFFPCYGLAEATLFVSGGPRTEAPRIVRVDAEALADHTLKTVENGHADTRTLVSCGTAWPDQHVQIVDPESMRPCAPGEIGEIWIAGPSVARGYWNRPADTERTFGGRMDGEESPPALRTGDLGVVLDGELIVTGRLKDLIIIRGRNHYPQDIEATVTAAHPALRPGLGAAFAIDVAGEEKLAVVHEVRRSALRDLDGAAVVAGIRKAVSDAHEVQVHTVALLKTGSLPKTTSGKIQRSRCRAGLLNGNLHEVFRDALPEDVSPAPNGFAGLDRSAVLAFPPEERRPLLTHHLQHLVARSLKRPIATIDPDAPLAHLGLDSLDFIELKVAIESHLHVPVPADDALSETSLARLAERLADQMQSGTGSTNGAPHPKGPIKTDLFAKCDTDGGYFGAYRRARDTYFTQPVLDGPIGPRMYFEGKEVVVWSINNYLGLAGHPHIHDRARQTLETHGTWSPMGSRLLTGNTHRHQALEARLAQYLGKEASIVFNFGYQGVIGTIASLVGEHDTVIVDSLSHACIVDGAMLASRGKPFRVFRHNDLDSLEDQLKAAHASRRGGLLVVTEGLFGMTGDLAPLPGICALKDQYEARLFIDDAHGFGVMGPTGAGTAEHQGVHDRVDLYFGTFAKSYAAIGGVTAGDERVIDYIRYNARPNIFAKSLPMVYVEAVDAALDLIVSEPERRERVWAVARRLQAGLADLGYNMGRTASPITPVYVPAGDEQTATRAIRLMRSDFGVFVSAVTYPVVPRGVVLFRLTATAAHTDADVDFTIDAFRKLRDHLDLDSPAEDGLVGTVSPSHHVNS